MKRYEKYKNSGFEWYGDVPSHWKLSPMKHLFEIRSGATPNTGEDQYWDGGIKWITPADFKTEDYHVNGGRKSISQRGLESCTASLLPIGSIVFSKRAPIGSVAITTDLLCTNQGCLGCIPFDVDSRFYYYSMSCLKNQFELFGSGTTFKEISATDFSNFMMLCPPLREQQVIADSLDSQCSKIDEMIEAKSKQIDDLKDYRKSLISEVVTKGLNPDVEMKESGMDWFGTYPATWSMSKLSRLTSKIGSGSTPRGGSEVYSESGVKFMRSQNVHFDGFLLDDVAFISPEIDEEMKNTRVVPGDILFNITGASIGRCYWVDETLGAANVNQHVCIVRPSDIQTKYLNYYLQSSSGQIQVKLEQTGGNREGLSAEAFKEFVILVPTVEEQQAIAEFLDDKCSKIADLMKMLGDEIEELKKYKTSIISEAVTGKIRVC